MFFHPNTFKLDISNKNTLGKFPHVRKLNNILLDNPRIKGEIKREIESITLN